jgi:hypothetical protein
MKSAIERTISKYLPSLRLQTRPLKLKNLPPIYQSLYGFEVLDIFEEPFLVIQVKDKTLGPKDFKKHSKILKDAISYPQIWYLQELHFNKVQRMIENELNFVIEDKQIHLPSLNMSIKPSNEKVMMKTQLLGLSINMLIREILKRDLSGKSKVEIATIFKTSKMTAGRAIESLIANDLCEETKVGVAKYVHFKDRSELWEFLKENIKSPIKEYYFIDKIPKALPYSGISALSRKSMLVEDKIEIYASEKKAFKKKFTNTKPVVEELAKSKIELWDRAPILVEDNCINVIDMFLVNREDDNERVQIELEELLEKNDLHIGLKK